MNLLLFLPYYVRWHYGRAFGDLYRNWRSIVAFLFSLFSVTFLIKTLFSPWRRLDEGYSKGFNPENFFSTLTVNFIMRIVGFMARLPVILFGTILTLLGVVLGFVTLILWTLFPIVLAFFLALGIVRFF